LKLGGLTNIFSILTITERNSIEPGLVYNEQALENHDNLVLKLPLKRWFWLLCVTEVVL